MTTPPTTADLTAKRERLETTHADVQKRQQATEAELRRQGGLDPTPENVTAFVRAQAEHEELTSALARTERLIAETDAELQRVGIAESFTADFEELVSLDKQIKAEQAAILEVYTEVNAYLQDKLESALQGGSRVREQYHRFRMLFQTHARAHILLGYMRANFSDEQYAAADKLEAELKARGVVVKDMLEGIPYDFPQPFGPALPGLRDVWERERHNHITDKEVSE